MAPNASLWAAVAGRGVGQPAPWPAPARRPAAAPRSCCACGQVARLNALGELAAGIGARAEPAADRGAGQHPGAAERLLATTSPTWTAHRARRDGAGGRAGAPRRRRGRAGCAAWWSGPTLARADAAANLARRRLVARCDLLEPECQRLRRASATVAREPPDRAVLADPVALEQIVHNLLTNALQALAAGAGRPSAACELGGAPTAATAACSRVHGQRPGHRARGAAAAVRALLHARAKAASAWA
ncbi:MAG: hypothetical protein MZW92_59625 [Comamonadaceae bacterium]|nr:hypothetical protein [Comamonadaceae bacterium]